MARRGSPCRAPEEPGGPWRRLRGTSLPFSDGAAIYIHTGAAGCHGNLWSLQPSAVTFTSYIVICI